MPTFVLQKDDPEEASPSPFLKDLNPQQRDAVQHTDGPLLIIAGAGSGKTRVLTYRIAHLLWQKKAWPNQILALTFTNKAAREMQDRISRLAGEQAAGLWMGTFHSLFSRVLRMEAESLGYTRDFSIYDTADSERLIRNILRELGINTREVKPRVLRQIISGAKNRLLDPDGLRDMPAQSSHHVLATEVYKRYTVRCKANNAMDFDDLLIKPIELFRTSPQILEKYQRQFRYVLIDEYQDTNHAQYQVTQMLASGHQNICVVGDDAQSIYSFRGADITNILNFHKDYPEARQISLEQNYRSTQMILKCADSVIRNNRSRLEKKLWTRNDQGETVTVIDNYDERDEANRIARMIDELKMRRHMSYRDFTVLYRTNYQSRVLEDTFRRKGIPYQLVGGISFYQRQEVKDVIAYLRLLVNPDDNESLLRVINEPPRGLGDRSIEKLLKTASNRKISLWATLQNIEDTEIYKPAIPKVREFVDTINRTRLKSTEQTLTDTVRYLLDETGYVRQFVEEHSHESLMRRQNVMEFLNAISYFEKSNEEPSLSQFLQEISLITDLDEHDTGKPSVTLMTVHSAKGLEFPVVFVAGLEEELFPIGRRSDDDFDLEEERRLFYVAVTRAEKQLFLSYARNRYRYGDSTPMDRSRFLDEIDASVIRTETGSTYQRSAAGNRSGHRPGETWIRYDDQTITNSQSFPDEQPAGRDSGTSFPSDEMTVDYDYDPADHDHETARHTLRPGMAVIHPSFGPGKILACDGSGDQQKVTVFFPKAGQKKLLVRLARLKVIH